MREKLDKFNRTFNDLPRKLAYILALVLALYVAYRAFIFVAPFVVGFLVSLIIEPIVGRLAPAFKKIRLGRAGASLLCVIVVYGALIFAAIMLTGRVLREAQDFVPRLIEYVKNLLALLNGWAESLTKLELAAIPEDFLLRASESISKWLNELGATVTNFAMEQIVPIASFAVNKAMSLPQIMMFVILMIVSTFYFSSDREKIAASVAKYTPDIIKQQTKKLRNGVYKAFFGQLKAMVAMFFVTLAELAIGFSIIGLDYAVLLALTTAILDALPVVGAGIVLIPTAVYGFIFGPIKLGVGMAIIYITTIVVRQIVEPKIIGQQFGLHPLMTMMAMFAGYMAMGFLGMLLGPILLLLCKAALADEQNELEKAAPPVGKRRKKR